MTGTLPFRVVGSRRLPFALLTAYVAFLLYGSFFPFDFTLDSDTIQRNLDRAVFGLRHASGRRALSIPDLGSNILLGLPFGVLLPFAGLGGRTLGTRLVSVALADVALASAVEAAQLLTHDRTTSVLDVVGQVLGSMAGVLVAQALATRALRLDLPRRPAVIALLVLFGALAADALYPYAVTLDVSTAWQNLKRAQWRPLGSLRQAFWLDLLVEKALAYAAVGALARVVLEEWRVAAPSLAAWTGATVVAVALEAGKLLIVGRAPSVDTILLGAVGALLGVLVLPAVRRAGLGAGDPTRGLVWAAAALLAYEELTPFDFSLSLSALQAKLLRIEWLPFASYYRADPESALFDLGKKLFLGSALGAACRLSSPRPYFAGAGILIGILEAAQLLQPYHTTSTGDACSLFLGVLLGAFVVGRVRAATPC